MVGISSETARKERELELSLYARDEIQCMEKGSSPKVLDDSLGSDGASPFTNTSSSSTSEDSSCGELSPEKLWGPTPVSDASTESPLGSDKHSSPIARLMERTGYSIVQQNGQRRYGPPPDWEGEAPSRGCEVFVGKIPRDCFEDELVPVFDRMGKIYELRLMMDYTGLNRGYAFVVYGDVASAKESVRQLNNYEIRKGRTLGVCMSVDNCRLFVGGIPKKVSPHGMQMQMLKHFTKTPYLMIIEYCMTPAMKIIVVQVFSLLLLKIMQFLHTISAFAFNFGLECYRFSRANECDSLICEACRCLLPLSVIEWLCLTLSLSPCR